MIQFGIDSIEILEMMNIQTSAWKIGYKNLLPDSFLSKLPIEHILSGWKNIVEYHKTKGLFVKFQSDDKYLGFCSGLFEESNNLFEIRMLYVKPENWKVGVGTELFKAMDQAVKDKYKTSNIYLWTILNNFRSRSFYEKNGMKTDYTLRMKEFFGNEIEEIKYELCKESQ